MPVAYSADSTCPTSCRLRNNGCYAQQGPLGRHWAKVSRGEHAVGLVEFCRLVEEEIGPRRIWRYGVAGDLPGTGDLIAPNDMERLVIANFRRPVLAYTHKPVVDSPVAKTNRSIIEEALKLGFNINLSADSPERADTLVDLELAPVVTILPREYARRYTPVNRYKHEWTETIGDYRDRIASLPTETPKGRRIAVCPATVSTTTCAACQACAQPRAGGAIIGFPARGRKAKKAELAHLAARDVPPGFPWTFSEHRSLAEVEVTEPAAAA